ncbi:hypothetical protein B9T19_07640 [Ignatzschineria sp. F8392]|uniref:vWA domain-containing protein n=1 Tax=Ignatzschineria sp. F8392 TaxID=1980117 RepID=UPI000B993550|nr:VWA domain-containing protein [Ignatzschineria sp. F8392]OYQ78711.1 hypothetical protein B9T19_07640 [Ignatzschineria sp. F8392]
MNDYILNLEDLVENPTARVPVCLCLDVSSSMQGEPIKELNEGVKLFYETLKEDETALYAAEICIVTFGGDYEAECLTPFSSLELNPNPPILTANGMTPMGEAVNLGLDLLEERKKEYQDKGVDYYQPWLVLMTDGIPNGTLAELERAIDRTTTLIHDRKLTIFPIGIGNHADMEILNEFSPERAPLKLQGLKFKEFFLWLSQSVSRTSQSIPGEEVILDIEGIKGWGTL